MESHELTDYLVSLTAKWFGHGHGREGATWTSGGPPRRTAHSQLGPEACQPGRLPPPRRARPALPLVDIASGPQAVAAVQKLEGGADLGRCCSPGASAADGGGDAQIGQKTLRGEQACVAPPLAPPTTPPSPPCHTAHCKKIIAEVLSDFSGTRCW